MSQPSLRKSLPAVLHLLRYFSPLIKNQRPLITASLSALFFGVLLRLAEPWPLKFILDRVIPSDRPEGMHSLGMLEGMTASTLLLVMALSLVGLSGLRGICDYHQKLGFAKIGNRILRTVRERVYLHVQGLSLAFHKKARSGDLIVRVTRDVSLLRDVSSTALLPLLGSVMVLLGMMAVMLLLEWRLAIMALIAVPLFWISTVKIGRGIHQAARKQRRREGAMAATAAESLHAIEVVQALSLEDSFAENFAGRNRESQKEDLKGARLSAKMGRTVDLLVAVVTAAVLYYGAMLVLEARMTPGDLIVFLSYLKRGFRPVKDLAKYSARLAKATAAGERVLELLEQEPDIQDRPDALEAPRFAGEIQFHGVGLAYEPGTDALAGVDLKIAAGEILALSGASGSGKSSLASLLLRLYDPTAGRVCIDGHDLRDMTVSSVRRQISVVLQDSLLFAGSLRENIAIGLDDVSDEQMIAAAKLANAHDFITAMPDGYDTQVGERGTTLSRGQRQRIAIARAALRETPILILDEPLTGLDQANREEVSSALVRLAEGRSTLLISHDQQLLDRAQRVVELRDGRLVASAAEGVQGAGR